jgi:predicted kinase
MTSSLCGSNDDFWEEAYQATKVSLEKRIALWDAVHAKILEQKHHTS